MKPVTLEDLAQRLNISRSTVSKALKGRSDVSKKTRKKVLSLAKELNYVPNLTAVYLRTQRTKTIGVIIPTLLNQFFSKVIIGIIEEAEKHGYLVITLQSNERFELEQKHLQLLMEKQVDGILISLSNQTNRVDHLNMILKNEIPIVMFDKINKLVNCSKVIIDDQQAAYNAVTHLIDKGYRRIAHFRGSLNPQNSIDRFLGYRKALIDNSIEFDASLVYLCDNNDDFNDGYTNAQKLLKEHPDVDAIFTITDVVAVGILKYFNENGIKIPKDIALFGFSNWFMTSVITPSLSTVKQPDIEMGEKAVEVLIDEIEKTLKKIPITPKKVVLPTSLIIRDSCL